MPNTEEKRTFRDRINDEYRIEILDIDTLQKVFTYSGKPVTLITILALSIIGIFGICYLLIAYSPLKRTMPGYADFKQDAEFNKFRKNILELEKKVEQQEVYNRGLRVLLSNDAEEVVQLSQKALEQEAKKVEADREAKPQKDVAVASSSPSSATTAAVAATTAAAASKIVTKEEVDNLPVTKEGKFISQAQINETKYTKKLDNIYFVTPISGLVSASFDLSINHYGTDIVAPKNTPVKSIANGVVVAADWTRETGNTISVQHENNIIAHYKHNSSLLKNVGDIVSAGEAIAIIGNTGRLTDGPHLHFELWYNGVPVNPENFFTFK